MFNITSISSSILITIQFQLVKYRMKHIANRRYFWLGYQWIVLFCLFKVGRWFKIIRNCTYAVYAILDNYLHFFTLWTGRENHYWIRRLQWRTQWVWLVFVANRNATDVCDFLIRHSKSRENGKLCEYFVRARNIKNGIDFTFIMVNFSTFTRANFRFHF